MSANDDGRTNSTQTQEAPDPDEDDLDDLDEMLDEFSSTRISQPTQTQPQQTSQVETPSAPGNRETNDVSQPSEDEDDFQKKLEEGMNEMMRELDANPDMAKEFEKLMMGQFGAGEGIPAAASDHKVPADIKTTAEGAAESSESVSGARDAAKPAQGQGQTPSFQDTIRQTMNRMRDSNASASAASNAPEQSSDDFMTAMLNEIAQSQGTDGNPEDTFSNMLLGMMEQLTNKDILYEPMKDLSGKFPEWLQEREPGKSKANSISDEDRRKYQEQSMLVNEIVNRFERPGYSDQNSEDREFIVQRMQKMQAAGAPPADLVGDMGGAAEMLGGLDSQCPQQ